VLLIALFLPSAHATDFLQVDAGAPGMAVQVSVLRDVGGFTGSEVVTTSCSDIIVGPVAVLDRSADPATPLTGSLLQTVFFIDSAASTGECTVSIDGTALGALSTGIDNDFSIVTPESAPVDGSTNDADGTVDGVITLSSSLRSDGGTLVLDGLDIPAGETLVFDTSDPDAATDGNEAYLPLILLVDGGVTIDGTIYLAGEDGAYAGAAAASDGGNGGPGGGGGGVGSNCYAVSALAGDGFTGGGGTVVDTCTLYGDGGLGAVEGNDGEHGGEGVFTDVENSAVGYAGGTGGGTGVPWGTGGGGGEAYIVAGAGGFGGGGGAGHCDTAGWGAGGGGFGTDGENGMGTVGGGPIEDSVGGAGYASGHDTLAPLAGGSGGAGGESGSGAGDGAGGAGGGGALLLHASSIAFGTSGLIEAYGGDGGDCYGVNPGSSTAGGGGSGGGVFLAAAEITGMTDASFDLIGGYGGVEGSGVYFSGDGGEGRLRVDGTEPPALAAGPTGSSATTFEGPAFTDITDTDITISSSGAATLEIYDSTGAYVNQVALAADGSATLYPYFVGDDTYLLVLVDDASGVFSPAGVATIVYVPDADGDGYDHPDYGGLDCDDTDADVNPGADEVCDSIDNDCDGDIDEASATDASTWYADTDGDGYGDASSTDVACDEPTGYVADATDCDDGDGAVNPAATEVCDSIDNDCDGDIDEASATDASTWYADTDADGYGDASSTDIACDEPSGYVADATDCDDTEAAAHPGADEVCDSIDNDCDGDIDEASATDASTWYADEDGDGYGDASSTDVACDEPTGYVANADDCDDGEPFAYPGADEVCDGIDNDCDDVVDGPDAEGAATWYADADDDSYGDPSVSESDCEQPSGFVEDDTDCDDTDPTVYPGADDIEDDGIDQDCDGSDAQGPGDTADGGAGGKADGDYEGGCSCASAAGGSAAFWPLLFGALGLIRRRRT
jgi:MYXO-CTERM domain-containing protein